MFFLEMLIINILFKFVTIILQLITTTFKFMLIMTMVIIQPYNLIIFQTCFQCHTSSKNNRKRRLTRKLKRRIVCKAINNITIKENNKLDKEFLRDVYIFNGKDSQIR
jgi:hypothetical protein